jgi:hypothetical protein
MLNRKKLLYDLLLLSTESHFSSLKIDIVLSGKRDFVRDFEISYPEQTPGNEISL